MEVKAFAATLGAGMLAGAAVAMLVPKDSKVYQAAEDAAKTMEKKASKAVDDLMK